jgi:hypothetical protein
MALAATPVVACLALSINRFCTNRPALTSWFPPIPQSLIANCRQNCRQNPKRPHRHPASALNMQVIIVPGPVHTDPADVAAVMLAVKATQIESETPVLVKLDELDSS